MLVGLMIASLIRFDGQVQTKIDIVSMLLTRVGLGCPIASRILYGALVLG